MDIFYAYYMDLDQDHRSQIFTNTLSAFKKIKKIRSMNREYCWNRYRWDQPLKQIYQSDGRLSTKINFEKLLLGSILKKTESDFLQSRFASSNSIL